MFHEAQSFNQSLNSWNVSSARNMDNMFSGAISFNQPLNRWDTQRVTNMDSMFSGAISFNQLLNWDITNVISRQNMFQGSRGDIFISGGNVGEFEFEETDNIDERNMHISEPGEHERCKDLFTGDDIRIEEYLSEEDTFLFINNSPNEHFDILCYEKSYIENILDDKNNWFYECTGNILENGNRTIDFGRNENNAFIKLPLNIDGLNGFIPLIQVRKIIGSNDRIYYIYLDIQNQITHSISWTNAFGSREERDWVNANHCQVGSNLLVYKLKVCRDPEMCVRSIL
jgi:surface protein